MKLQPKYTLLACGLALFAGTHATAQAPGGARDAAFAGDLHAIMSRSFGMDYVDGALRAGGPAYKAEFGTDGVRFTPALGERATQNYPLTFVLESIRRGNVTLFEAATAVHGAPRQDGMIAAYDRGNGVIETYEARAGGLKQNFTFAQAPAGQGDLVVTGRIVTDLLLQPTGDQRAGLTFTAEGLGGVTIGQVLGIDAAGARVDGAMAFDGERVQFSLPAQFVDEAAYPMVLDPFFGSLITVDSSGAKDPDVAFDETYDDYLVVWELTFSSLDIDVRAQKFDTAGNLVATAIFVTNEIGNEINPAVANVDAGSDYFVAYQDSNSPFGLWNIRGRRVDGGTVTTVSALIDVAATAADEVDPDVGGDNSQIAGSNDGVIVVWSNGAGIVAAKVDVNTAAPDPAVVVGPVTINGAAASTNPAITKSGGLDGRLMIVWERDYTTDRDVQGALVDRDLNVLDNYVLVAGGIPDDEFNADVDGDGSSFVVAFQEHESGLTGPSDVYCRRFDWNGSALVASTAIELVDGTSNQDERDPAIGNFGNKYVIAYAEEFSGINYDIAAIEINPATCLSCGLKQVSAGGGVSVVDIKPEIASRWHGRYSVNPIGADQGMIVWMDAQGAPPFDSDVVAFLYEAYGGGAVANLGGGCGSGGSHGFNGPLALGNSSFGLSVTGAGSDLLLCSIQFSVFTVNCSGCIINADAASYLFAPGSGGTSNLSLPIPCNTNLLGADIYTQWAAVLSGVNPCPAIPASLQISFSNRMQGTIGN